MWMRPTGRQRQQSADSIIWGLPITSSALAIPAVYLIGEFTAIHTQTIAALVLLIIGICYVLPVKLKKPSLLGEVLLVGIGAVEFCILIAEVLI